MSAWLLIESLYRCSTLITQLPDDLLHELNRYIVGPPPRHLKVIRDPADYYRNEQSRHVLYYVDLADTTEIIDAVSRVFCPMTTPWPFIGDIIYLKWRRTLCLHCYHLTEPRESNCVTFVQRCDICVRRGTRKRSRTDRLTLAPHKVPKQQQSD